MNVETIIHMDCQISVFAKQIHMIGKSIMLLDLSFWKYEDSVNYQL